MTCATQRVSTSDRLLRWAEVQRRVGYSRSQIHRLILKGQFPHPHKLGARTSAWLESSIDEWTASQMIDSKQGDLGLRAAVNSMCKSCIYDPYQKGTWMKQVRECTTISCPLYSVRPA